MQIKSAPVKTPAIEGRPSTQPTCFARVRIQAVSYDDSTAARFSLKSISTHSLTHSLTHLLTHSLTHALTHLLSQSQSLLAPILPFPVMNVWSCCSAWVRCTSRACQPLPLLMAQTATSSLATSVSQTSGDQWIV